MTVEQCQNGHPTPTSAYRTANGTCRECQRDAKEALRIRQRAAWVFVKGLEASGLRFENNGVPMTPAEFARQLVDTWDDDEHAPAAAVVEKVTKLSVVHGG
jgi:hypothetical protein